MRDRATLVATLTEPLGPGRLEQLADSADLLEVRGDLLDASAIDIEALRAVFPGRLLYTLRSRAEGGEFSAAAVDRVPRLKEAARHYDLLDLEADRDLGTDLLAAVAPERRILSWHGPPARSRDLGVRLRRMMETGARHYKLVPWAGEPAEALAPLRLLAELGRDDVTLFAAGPAATWTRLVAPRLGSPLAATCTTVLHFAVSIYAEVCSRVKACHRA